MDFSTLLNDAYTRNVIILTGVFALFAITLIPAYFLTLRPARGTTEWMSRIDKPSFEPLSFEPLRWSDLPFALLAGICAAMLRMVSFLCIYLHKGVFVAIYEIVPMLAVSYLAPCVILGISIYMVLRAMFDAPLPAVCVAILSGLVQVGNAWAAAAVTVTILFFWLWMGLDADSNLFVRALLLFLALVSYGVTLMRYWALFWLLPMFIAGYIYVQIYRWRNATRSGRGMRLGLSLLFVFFMAFLAYVASWIYYCCASLGDPSKILDIRLSLQTVVGGLIDRFRCIGFTSTPFATVLSRDVIMFLLGLLSVVPAIHGIIRWHDSQCIVILAILPLFVAIWLLGGMYLFVPALAIIFGWVLSVIAKREYNWLVIAFCVIPAVTFLLGHFI